MRIYEESPSEIVRRGWQTRRRRQSAGKYPTEAHKEAFKKLMRRDGHKLLTREEMLTLSTHPYLAQSQREEWAKRAAELAA